MANRFLYNAKNDVGSKMSSKGKTNQTGSDQFQGRCQDPSPISLGRKIKWNLVLCISTSFRVRTHKKTCAHTKFDKITWTWCAQSDFQLRLWKLLDISICCNEPIILQRKNKKLPKTGPLNLDFLGFKQMHLKLFCSQRKRFRKKNFNIQENNLCVILSKYY